MYNHRNILILLIMALVIFSYGFMDPNFPFAPPKLLHDVIFEYRAIAAFIYIGLVLGMYGWYVWAMRHVKRGHLSLFTSYRFMLFCGVLLLFSFPGFSYDLFNYIATAKVLFHYGENPYIVMPIQFVSEPMLAYIHAANKTALYGLGWILLTSIPYFAGFGSIVIQLFAMKLFVLIFYIGLAYLIWIVSNRNAQSVLFFVGNPLVLIETLVSAHNDVVMMFFALLSLYFIRKRIYIGAGLALLFSIGIKYASIVLLPVLLYIWIWRILHRKLHWDRIYLLCAALMGVVFFLSPLREEMYSWYFIWPLTFIAVSPRKQWIDSLVIAFSFGLLMRFTPFILTRNWFGSTPLIKIVVTALPVVLVVIGLLFIAVRKKIK